MMLKSVFGMKQSRAKAKTTKLKTKQEDEKQERKKKNMKDVEKKCFIIQELTRKLVNQAGKYKYYYTS